MNRLFGATCLLAVVLSARPATASTIPLVDLPPDVKTISAGIDPQMVHLSADWALGGAWGTGWSVGAMGSYDISNAANARESQTMGAVRVTRKLGGTFPFSWGLTLSVGMNLVDPTIPATPDEQVYTSPYLFWVQPALNVSTTVFGDFFNDNLWLRGTVGPVLGRWTSGEYYAPYIAPNVELSYRVLPSQELVLGGGFFPWGLGWRAAF